MFPVKEAAKKLGISATKLRQLVSRREISFYRIGGKILFSDELIQDFLAGCRVEKATKDTALPPRKVNFHHLR
jgi:excisionase family DNA binding protein